MFVSLAALLSMVAGNDVLAVPAVPWPVEKIQPDGSVISVYLRGDEKVHWMESLDGYTLMYSADRYVVYAEQDAQGNLTPSGTKVSNRSVAPAHVKKGLRYSPSQVQALKEIWAIASGNDDAPQRSSGQQRAGSATGQRKALCVLMSFTDKDFTKPNTEFETLFNQLGLYNTTTKGSVRDFFRENSYGQLDLTVTVVGPYLAPNTREYYASRQQEFAKVAAQEADKDVDFNEFADDGRLETFHILFAGYGDENIGDGKQIWSHKWQIQPITLDGVRIAVYSCSPELRGSTGSNTTYVGVICHELCHVFGAPDYYDTNNDTGGMFVGTGNWDLMANGSWNDNGRQPAHINMFQKILYGWVTPVELTEFTEVSAMPPSASEAVAYIIQANENGESYVLENRQQTGFDTSVPGHGLLIWHLHPSALGGNGSNDGHPQQLYPVVASSTYQIPNENVSSYGNINSAGTPFPGSSSKRAFTARTTPAMFTWADLQPISKPLTEIKEASDKTVSFKFMDGATVPVTDLRAEVTGGTVKLIWTAPNHEGVQGYKIYRNGVLQYTMNSPSSTTYTQINIRNGSYEYGVRAFYEATESEIVTIPVVVSEGSDTYYFPPGNLQGKASPDKITLTWQAPFSGGWMGISGDHYSTYGFNQEWESFQGTLWNPSDLAGLDGYKITKIKFIPVETAATYEVAIYKVPAEGDPVAIYTQKIPSIFLAYNKVYNEIALSTPVVCNAAEGLIVGVQIHSKGGYYICVDNGTPHEGRNIYHDEDGWYIFEDLGIPSGQNFCLAAYFDGASGSAPVVLGSTSENLRTLSSNDAKANTSFLKKEKPGKSLKMSDIQVQSGADKAPLALTKYVIYRDGVKTGETTETTFEDSNLTPETTYSYCVSAVYGDQGESENICTELTTWKLVNPYRPVENFTATLDGSSAKLSWKAPFSGGDFGYSTRSTSISSYNLTGIMAIRLTQEELKKLVGCQLTGVRFAAHSNVSTTNTTYTLRVYAGADGSKPERAIHEQAISSFSGGAWNTVNLTTPIDINVYEDLWIGIEVAGSAAAYRMSCDPSQPATDERGNILYYNNQWTTLLGLGGGDYNWAILGIATSDETSSTPENYVITRNGVAIATVPNTVLAHEDPLLSNGKYTYGLTTQYPGGHLSDIQTAVVLFGVTGINTVDATALGVYPNPVKSGQTFSVKTDTPDALIQIYSLSGLLVKQQRATGLETKVISTFPAGIYILSAGKERIKIVVQ